MIVEAAKSFSCKNLSRSCITMHFSWIPWKNLTRSSLKMHSLQYPCYHSFFERSYKECTSEEPLNFTIPCHANSCEISQIFLSKIRKTNEFSSEFQNLNFDAHWSELSAGCKSFVVSLLIRKRQKFSWQN